MSKNNKNNKTDISNLIKTSELNTKFETLAIKDLKAEPDKLVKL